MPGNRRYFMSGIMGAALVLNLAGCDFLDNLEGSLDALDERWNQQMGDEVADMATDAVDKAIDEAFSDEGATVALSVLNASEDGAPELAIVSRSEMYNGGLVTVSGEATKYFIEDGESQRVIDYDLTISIEDVTLSNGRLNSVVNGEIRFIGTTTVAYEDYASNFEFDDAVEWLEDFSVLPCSVRGAIGETSMVGTLDISGMTVRYDLAMTLEGTAATYAGSINGRDYDRVKEDLAWDVCDQSKRSVGSCTDSPDDAQATMCVEYAGMTHKSCIPGWTFSRQGCNRPSSLLGYCEYRPNDGFLSNLFPYNLSPSPLAETRAHCEAIEYMTWIPHNP